MKKRALLSVSDKAGIVEFARGLAALGFELVSTGGTHRALEQAGLAVMGVSKLTQFPECLDGRVKTLHPAVHGGILAVRKNESHMRQISDLGIAPIDLVAINLYPFKQTVLRPGVTLEEAVENIDIGGPSMLRAAAKNWQDVVVVCDPADYAAVLEELSAGGPTLERRLGLAKRVFEHTAAYDALIASYLRGQTGGEYPDELTLTFEKAQDLRYGENPHQTAAFYKEIGAPAQTLPQAAQHGGKELSYNNIHDADGALAMLRELGDASPWAVGVKHANPCGVATGESILEAWKRARDADSVSIFGGIVALNRAVDAETAAELAKTFLEVIIAPEFSPEALLILNEKKNLRLLKLPGCAAALPDHRMDLKRVAGGLLVQRADDSLYGEAALRVVTRRAPTVAEMEQLRLAMAVVKHVRSNGICLVRDGATVGIGPGQTNRVTALELAIRYAGDRAAGSVMGSDAFFPFDDCVKLAAEAGVTAIIQPGGSVRDADSIAACDAAGIAMVFTGERHFKH